MSTIIDKIINFITESPIKHITTASIIYKIMDDIPMIQKEELLETCKTIIQIMNNRIERNSILFKKLQNVPK